jgi:hypothetical protein
VTRQYDIRECVKFHASSTAADRPSQDCNCKPYCKYCSIRLDLHVTCTDNRTIDITSNHLDIVLQEVTEYDGTDGEELSKRAENFGYPVGKSELLQMSSSVGLYQQKRTVPR